MSKFILHEAYDFSDEDNDYLESNGCDSDSNDAHSFSNGKRFENDDDSVSEEDNDYPESEGYDFDSNDDERSEDGDPTTSDDDFIVSDTEPVEIEEPSPKRRRLVKAKDLL